MASKRKAVRSRKPAGARKARPALTRQARIVERIRSLKDAVTAAIDSGATSVQEVHQRIAAMPFARLQRFAVIEGLVRRAQDVHDQSIGTVYDTVRAINARIGELAEAALQRLGQGRGQAQ